jgi:uncharacterized membrane protein YgcG
MSVLSTVSCALLSAVSAFTLVTAAGCGTDAKGVDDCRDIEEARCTAAKNCGIVSDVAECQNFYRDQCLHGLAVSTPSSTVLKQCVATIRAAGVCALQGADTAVADCTDGNPSTATTATTTCAIVTNPETTTECSFLMPTVDAGTAGSGGAGGAAGSAGSGGSAGTGGSAGSSDAGGAGGAGGAGATAG